MDIEGRSDMSQVEYVETPEKEGAWDAEWEGPSRELLQELWKSANQSATSSRFEVKFALLLSVYCTSGPDESDEQRNTRTA